MSVYERLRFFRIPEAYFTSPYTPSVEGWTSINSSKSWTETGRESGRVFMGSGGVLVAQQGAGRPSAEPGDASEEIGRRPLDCIAAGTGPTGIGTALGSGPGRGACHRR